MGTVIQKGQAIFSDGLVAYRNMYWEILEMMARFGYVSIKELMYGFNLSLQASIDRLRYLEKVNLIERFPSHTIPRYFFSLTAYGRRMVQTNHISDEINMFRPLDYNVVYQRHQRTLVQVFLALRKILGAELQGWISESLLRQDSGLPGNLESFKGRRVFDGQFLMRVQKSRFKKNGTNEWEMMDRIQELWTCGLELELTMKSASRYKKQFRSLCDHIYDPENKKQKIPLVLFLYSTPGVYHKLVKHVTERSPYFGECYFVFGQADQFLKDLGSARLTKYLGKDHADIEARDLNQVQTKVGAS